MSLSERIQARADEIEAERKDALPAAASVLAETLRETLGEQGTPERPSRPGEAPHRITGRLLDSVIVDVDPATGRASVGTTAPYGKYLLATRPYLRQAFDRCSGAIRALLLGR